MFKYFRLISKGVYPLIGRDLQWINLVHAYDLVEAIVSASSCERAVGETYHIGSERQYTTEEVGQTIAKVAGRTPIRVHLPQKLVFASGAIVGATGSLFGLSVFFNLEKAREATQRAWVCSVCKARDHFGYRQSVGLEEGFRETYEWYLEHGWLN
jgi:nucleoside-diphosphate-sugar epimerase